MDQSSSGSTSGATACPGTSTGAFSLGQTSGETPIIRSRTPTTFGKSDPLSSGSEVKDEPIKKKKQVFWKRSADVEKANDKVEKEKPKRNP